MTETKIDDRRYFVKLNCESRVQFVKLKIGAKLNVYFLDNSRMQKNATQ